MTAALLPPPLQDMSLPLDQPDLLRRQSSCSISSSRSHRSAGSLSAASIRFSARSAASGTGSICPQCALMGIRICQHCTTKAGSSTGRSSINRQPAERFGSKAQVSEISAEASQLLLCLRQSQVDLEEVAEILSESKAACNAPEPSFGWTPILFAAHIGDVKLMSLLLEAKANPKVTCSQGNSALHLAARQGHVDTAELLLSRGLDIEATNAQGWTPLMWSAIAGCSLIAFALLDAAANPRVSDNAGRTACMWAARHGHADILRALLPLGTDLSLRDEDGLTVKDHSHHYANMQATLKPASRATSISMENGGGLYWATSEGSLDLQRLLMQHGAGSHPTDCSKGGQFDDEGPEASVKAVEKAMETSLALLAAARKNDWDAAEEALRSGACASTRGDPDLASPLIWAAIHEAPAVAMSLVAALADLEAPDALGWTALHHAVHSGSTQMVAVLHYLGSDFTSRTEEGDSVQHLAVLSDAGVMLQLLSPATKDWSIRDASGLTPLQVAATRGCMGALTTLLALKADANVKDSNEQTIFATGVGHGHEDVVRALISPVDPPQHKWDEDDLNQMLDKLPWVDSDVVDGDCNQKCQRSHSSASSVCSGSTLNSSTSVRNAKLGRGLASKQLAKKSDMHTIKEVDSEAGSTLSVHAGAEEDGSKVSQKRPSSADSHVSRGSVRSNATQRSVAKSVRSTKSGAASVKGSARSVCSLASAGTNARSQISLHSKVGSKVSISRSNASGMSRTSGHSRVSRNPGSRVGNMSPTIYTAAVTVIDRSPVSLMSAASKRCLRSQLPAPMSAMTALSAENKNGCKPLALAAQARHSHLVSLLLELKAAPNSPDLSGNTALILAATVGDKESVMLLLGASAFADTQNAEGLQAVDATRNADIRQLLREHMDRTVVAKKLSKSCSLPALVKPPASKVVRKVSDGKSSTFRLRLDGLPLRVQADDIEKEVFDILRRCRVPRPLQMEVVVDPITLLSRGHCFMVYASREQCEVVEECVSDEFDDPILTSIEEVRASQ